MLLAVSCVTSLILQCTDDFCIHLAHDPVGMRGVPVKEVCVCVAYKLM